MILIDTHVLLWWVDEPGRLSGAIRRAIQESEHSGILISLASIWEMAIKVEGGKLALARETSAWISAALSYPGARLEQISVEDAISSARLPRPFHGDPFDRIIVAQARRLAVPLVTVDRKLLAYPHVQTVS